MVHLLLMTRADFSDIVFVLFSIDDDLNACINFTRIASLQCSMFWRALSFQIFFRARKPFTPIHEIVDAHTSTFSNKRSNSNQVANTMTDNANVHESYAGFDLEFFCATCHVFLLANKNLCEYKTKLPY